MMALAIKVKLFFVKFIVHCLSGAVPKIEEYGSFLPAYLHFPSILLHPKSLVKMPNHNVSRSSYNLLSQVALVKTWSSFDLQRTSMWLYCLHVALHSHVIYDLGWKSKPISSRNNTHQKGQHCIWGRTKWGVSQKEDQHTDIWGNFKVPQQASQYWWQEDAESSN